MIIPPPIPNPTDTSVPSSPLVHDVRGIDRFLGWDHQLHNEPAVQFAIERKYKRFAEGAIRPGWGHDLVASHAVRLGNIETAASVGLEGRFGWNLQNDFGRRTEETTCELQAPRRISTDV